MRWSSKARRFAINPRAIGVVNKVGGGLLVSAGIANATLSGARTQREKIMIGYVTLGSNDLDKARVFTAPCSGTVGAKS